MRSDSNQIAIKQKSDLKYKDTLFRTLFREKDRAIELCNAVAGTNYPKDASVVVCDLENSLFRRYNDLALAFEDQLIFMYEHQSSINPNMPLRFLSFITDALYTWFVDTNEIYRSTVLKIPAPQFYVLYNGKKELKQDMLKLSDAFKIKPVGPSMDLAVKVLDVNYDSGCEALNKSTSLNGYAYLIAQIRNYESKGIGRDLAINEGIQKCIDEGILVDFLREKFEEVAKMLAWEYNQDAEFRIIREEAREEGREEGREETKIETVLAMIKKGFDALLIAEITKMPIEWVRKIIASETNS